MKANQGGLRTGQLVMLALGSVVGGSFFLGTAVSLRSAGLSTLIAFAAAGVLVYIILMALSELTVSRPVRGSFRTYARMAFGPMSSFVVGWLYWTGLVLALSSEATATALFARKFLPGVPVWVLSLAVIAGVTALNLLDVSVFSLIESIMAAGKLLAVGAFILLVGAAAFGLLPGHQPWGTGLLLAHPFLPMGLTGLSGSMLTVLFTYAGFEVMGLAAPDASDPERTIPRAVTLTVIALVALYLLAMAAVLLVMPLGALHEDVSPMVLSLTTLGMPGLAAVLNIIVMTAAISTLLAAMYGLSRMLQSLAQDGQAPSLFKRVTPDGNPRYALFASSAAMLIGVVLAKLLPAQVYLFLVSSGGFALLATYLMILLSHYVLRRQSGCGAMGCQLPFFPYSNWLGVGGLVLAIFSMPFIEGQGAGLLAGVALTFFLVLVFLIREWLGQRPADPEEPQGDRLLLR